MPVAVIIALLTAAITSIATIGSATINRAPQLQYNQNMLLLAVLNSQDPIMSLLLLQIMQGNTGTGLFASTAQEPQVVKPKTWVGGLPYEPWNS